MIGTSQQIQLPGGQIALVDGEDLPWLAIFEWKLNHGGYACRSESPCSMHRLIMDAKRGEVVDHINGDRLNNRRKNLRITDHAGNGHNVGLSKNNKTGFKGVKCTTTKVRTRWFASIRTGDDSLDLGEFDSPEQAAAAYDNEALNRNGDFACINGILPEHRARAKRCILTPAQAEAAFSNIPNGCSFRAYPSKEERDTRKQAETIVLLVQAGWRGDDYGTVPEELAESYGWAIDWLTENPMP